MIWLYAEDSYYFNNIEELKEEYNLNTLLIIPTQYQIQESITKGKLGVLSYTLPPQGSCWVVITLENKFGIYTTQDKDCKITEEEILSNKLGLDIRMPKVNFTNLGGAEKLKLWADRIEIMKGKNLPIKATFLLGMPGVGKSYFIECYSGHLQKPMIELNLPLIMESDNPVKALLKVFEYLADTKIECIVRIDEIARMLINKTLLGQLLTILNDLNTTPSYYLNGVLFATENNIQDIIVESPQFFRHGRWNNKFFANYPKEKEAINIYSIYAKQNKLPFNDEDLVSIYIAAEMKFKDHIQEGRSAYVPSEISYLMERLSMYKTEEIEEHKKEIIQEELEIVKPQYLTAAKGISKMLGEANTIGFEEI
jgi:hypothetical protein